ncbi:MAG: hypothetical protein C0446_00800 [Chitinophaga sp.]|jgi:hypothetical protein|nr:hypothetical protein [Chitinophaga sp.]PJE47680.1 MAG: hypothetical protein CUR34_03810 [Sediminibacterium sp.] [Sediminibacterium sp. FEMGT703S]
MNNWKDIFKKNTEISNEELLKYLDNDISEDEMHTIEQKMSASDFENDALEGLAQFKSREKIISTTDIINQQLKKQIAKSNKRKKKRKIEDQQWLIAAILIILLFSIAGYFLIHFNR